MHSGTPVSNIGTSQHPAGEPSRPNKAVLTRTGHDISAEINSPGHGRGTIYRQAPSLGANSAHLPAATPIPSLPNRRPDTPY